MCFFFLGSLHSGSDGGLAGLSHCSYTMYLTCLQIRGMSVTDAIAQMQFSPKKAARFVLTVSPICSRLVLRLLSPSTPYKHSVLGESELGTPTGWTAHLWLALVDHENISWQPHLYHHMVYMCNNTYAKVTALQSTAVSQSSLGKCLYTHFCFTRLACSTRHYRTPKEEQHMRWTPRTYIYVSCNVATVHSHSAHKILWSLSLYQPMTHICHENLPVPHKPIRIYV